MMQLLVFYWTCLDDATVFCVNYGLFPDSQVFFVKCAKCKYLIIDQTTNKSIHYTKPIACIQDDFFKDVRTMFGKNCLFY